MPELTNLDDLDDGTHAEVFEERTPRVVRLHLEQGESVPPHTHPESNIVLHLLSGQLELELGDTTYDVSPGDLVQFSGDQEVSPHALEEAIAVLVFAPAAE